MLAASLAAITAALTALTALTATLTAVMPAPAGAPTLVAGCPGTLARRTIRSHLGDGAEVLLGEGGNAGERVSSAATAALARLTGE